MSQQNLASKPSRFLIVDHDPDVMELFVMLFELLGYEISTAASPKEAIEIAKDLLPDIVYTSLVFNEVNGFELCTNLRKLSNLAHTRIIALTGLEFPGMVEVCKHAGFNEYLLKPFSLEALAGTIDASEAARVKQMITG